MNIINPYKAYYAFAYVEAKEAFDKIQAEDCKDPFGDYIDITGDFYEETMNIKAGMVVSSDQAKDHCITALGNAQDLAESNSEILCSID